MNFGKTQIEQRLPQTTAIKGHNLRDTNILYVFILFILFFLCD